MSKFDNYDVWRSESDKRNLERQDFLMVMLIVLSAMVLWAVLS